MLQFERDPNFQMETVHDMTKEELRETAIKRV